MPPQPIPLPIRPLMYGRSETSVDNSLLSIGYSLIGIELLAVVLGVITVQCYFYFKRFSADGPLLRHTVAFLWVLLLFQLISCFAMVYASRISPLSAISRRLSWALVVPSLVDLICAVISQGFFIYTTYHLAPNIFLLLTQLFLLLSEIGFGMALMVKVAWLQENPNLTTMLESWMDHVAVTLISVCDFFTAAALAWSMNRRRSRTSRGSLLRVLGLYVMGTGLLTGTVSGFAALSSFLKWESSLTVLGIALGSVSTMTILANIHSRSLLYGSSGKSKAQRGGISMLVTVFREIDRESNHEGQHEYELRTRRNRFSDNIEGFKSCESLRTSRNFTTRTDSCATMDYADL